MLTGNQAGQASTNCQRFGAPTRQLRFLSLALLCLLCAAPVAWAQTSSSTLRGVVKDPNGAVVPSATVTLINTQRGDQRQVKTSDDGAYVFTSVDPGKYTLKVETTTGFKTYEQTNVTVSPTETRALDVTLEIGGASETVTVNAEEVSQLKTETGERSDTITAKQIDNLSIISRSSLELLRILPGVVAPDPGDPNSGIDRVTFGGGANNTAGYTVNGIRGQNNSVSIDGSRLIDIGSNSGTIITANNDMVQEVTVKTSNYAAEYGSSGVQISATTKAGSKDFHGELYDYIRPEKLQASDRSNTTIGAKRPKTNFNYPGGNIGGPIILPFTNLNRNRDKLFFFGAYEVQRQKPDRGSKLGTVPTAAERAGDFSRSFALNRGQYGNHLCPPNTIGWSDCNGQNGQPLPVPNGDFRPFRDPLGAALLNSYPLPNFVPAAGSALAAQGRNYASNIIAPENRTDLKMRFDYKVGDKTTTYLRLAREAETDDSPYGIWWGPSAFELPSHVVGTNLGRSAAFNVTSVLSPTMTNEVVFSASKLKLHYDYNDPSKVSKAALGVQNLQLPFGSRAQTPYAPAALISWEAGGANLWEPGGLPLFAINDSYSATETLSKVYNNHTIKFGGLLERATKVQNVQGIPEGQINFEASQARTTGNAFANLYTGRINGIDQSTNVPIGHFKFWNIEGYGQDSWKVRRNVTLEYGMRLALFTNNTEQTGLASVFDPAAYVRGQGPYLLDANGQPDLNKPNGFLLASRGEIPKSVFAGNPGVKLSPRLNLAWDVFGDGKTVLRGGAGVFYNRVQGNFQYAIQTLPPNYLTVHADSWGAEAAGRDITLSNLASFSPVGQAPGANCRTIGNCPGGFTSQDRHANDIPRITTVSLSLARRLPFQNVLEVAYVGTFGRHLPQKHGINFILNSLTSGTFGNANLADPVQRAAVGNNPAALAQLLPFPAYAGNGGGIQVEEFDGTSNYHSMQATLNRQLGKNLQYFLTYTFSKALGTTAVNESDGDAIVDPLNTRGRSYGVLPYDRTHIINLSYNYNLPNVARGSFANTFTRGLLNGWQMSGITTFQSGRPIHIRFTGAITGNSVLFSFFGNNAIAGGNSPTASGIAPIILRNPTTGNTDLNQNYLDPTAFAVPAFGTSGPAQSPFYIRSPRTSNYDMTLFKNFNISESKKLQFRAGFFDIFNQAFANPDLGDIAGLNGQSLALNTLNVTNPATGTCFRIPVGTPTGTGTVAADSTLCDPTKGFILDPNSLSQFGRIVNKHGHRRVELALKFYF
ncbi:MAG: carboxypeptidase regulatory-like domain-containing protein [Pyrinomonadaceae bacterium]